MTLDVVLALLAVIGWGVVCGGVVYEHLAVVPVWAKAPPQSLAMWQGEHRVKAERFWMFIHPLNLVLLGLALALSWSAGAVSLRIGIVLAAYVAILAITAVFFVPELMKLTLKATGEIPAPEWRARSRRWEVLSIVRGVIMIGLAFVLADALRLMA